MAAWVLLTMASVSPFHLACEQEARNALPVISWMWTGWSSIAGGPAPAELTAVTRRKNLSPRARFRTVCWVTITGRGFTGTHSEAEGSRECLAVSDVAEPTFLLGDGGGGVPSQG